MHARVPLDVDLEDRIVYGLTPMRLAYLVLAGLAAMAVWSAQSVVVPVRLPIVVVVLAAGGALAYGRFRGRPADAWLVDGLHFVMSTRRLTWTSSRRDESNDEAEILEAESEAA
jgi:PrgI family protein